MDVEDDHAEAHDDTGYFRKSNWHDTASDPSGQGRIVILEKKVDRPPKERIFEETLQLIRRLIGMENLVSGRHNGLSAHRAFAEALRTYNWSDPFEPYMNVMCNYKQYLDRQYAVAFFGDNGRGDLAELYEHIAGIAEKMAALIPQDFSAGELFNDRMALEPYCKLLLEIHDPEEEALTLL